MDFSGKIALVTGGTSGIGLATAAKLAQAGATVIAIGRNPERLATAESVVSRNGETIACDISSPSEIVFLMSHVKARWGRLDVLAINAGISDAPAIGDLTPATYNALMDINCRGATFTFVHALPLLAEGAAVVFTGSVGGRKGQPGDPLYAGSKGFIRAFVRSAGTDRALLKRGIRVNVVSPGPIATPLTSEATQDEAALHWIEDMIPMGRWGLADEVADAILFLASDAARFTTGAELTVDGGMAHA
ncbi:SDR family oxidoreductase [Sphingomonas sp. BIUV-7]|uniref:SDR family oxidoreductase n=1 Tax=Sphingomonas natans TaxID=3063330 RepID=A0ABT8YC31_9SPHN|nr:SDR family oxidoreductase [Sphingomonas sp. BIUV-7]MDO6415393.1 SDR family oxidoreductase [Sphingomonas sp. BIUV-7]